MIDSGIFEPLRQAILRRISLFQRAFRTMDPLKRKLAIISAAALGILLLAALLTYLAVDFLVELWWFNEVDRAGLFILRTFYRDIIGIGVTVLFVAIVYANFWIVARVVGRSREENDAASPGTLRSRLGRIVAGGSAKIFVPLSFALALPVLVPVYAGWERFLLFLSRPQTGVPDPALSKDLSFYFFDYPLYSLIQQELLITFSLILGIVFLCYRLARSKDDPAKKKNASGANVHLTVLIVILILIHVWSILLERVELLYEERHLPVFFGPGFVEMHYHLPLIWLAFLAFVVLSGAALHWLYTRKSLKIVAVSALFYLLFIGLRHVDWLPELLDRFYVEPNPVKAERLYIERNIEATLAAYDLDRVQTIDYPIESSLSPTTTADVRETLHNIPVWDRAFLKEVYDQLQGLRPYYNFVEIGVDRYRIEDSLQQVNIGARELNLAKLPAEAKSW